MADHILLEIDDPVAVIRLNRPARFNAFTMSQLRDLRAAVDAAVEDPAVVGIVITGKGRAFCAGLDAESLAQTAASGSEGVGGATAQAQGGHEVPGLFTWLLDVPKPVVAAVNGVAAGGGLALVAMCDVRFASTDASFTTIFLKRGLVAEQGTTWLLPRMLGPGRALEMLWSSRRVGAEEALRIGLVEFTTEPDQLLDRARDFVRDLAANASPAGIRDTKRMVYSHMGIGYPEALRDADRVTVQSLDRDDIKEGVQSYLEKRPPHFERLGKRKAR